MKILYGLCGEGMGHAMRTAVVARHLFGRGHSVEFVCSSGRAFDYMAGKWPGKVHRVVGLSSVLEGNSINPLKTFAKNLFVQTVASPFAHLGSLIGFSRPDVVLSDFDPWTARYASIGGLPLLAIDNIHFMNRFNHPKEMIGSDRRAASMMFPIVSEMVPSADRYLVTSFVNAPVRMPRTSIHLPILREELLGKAKTRGDHVVVYLNDKADAARTIGVLRGVREARFKVYGSPPQVAGGNVEVVPFSPMNFMTDLASSRAVIGGAGFTLMTEAIYSGKPMMAIPFEGQFEQILNANYLQGMGYGERAGVISVGSVERFLSREDRYREMLSGAKHDGNRGLLGAVDEWLQRWAT